MRLIKYSQEETSGKFTIQLTFKSLGQLLDVDDPSPYPHKEITEVAEDAIASHLADVPLKRDVELIIALPTSELNHEIQENLAKTIRQHFTFRTSEVALERIRKKSEVNRGFEVIAITAAITILVGGVIKLIPQSDKILTSLVQFFIAGTLTIINWVAIWDTYETYILEYRGLVRKMKIYEKAARMNIRIERA